MAHLGEQLGRNLVGESPLARAGDHDPGAVSVDGDKCAEPSPPGDHGLLQLEVDTLGVVVESRARDAWVREDRFAKGLPGLIDWVGQAVSTERAHRFPRLQLVGTGATDDGGPPAAVV
jgi:hypothetical protein